MVSKLKSWFLLLVLFILSVLIITPITLVDTLKTVVTEIEGWFNPDSIINSVITKYFPTLMLFLNNFVIIPLLIDLIAFIEDHKTKS